MLLCCVDNIPGKKKCIVYIDRKVRAIAPLIRCEWYVSSATASIYISNIKHIKSRSNSLYVSYVGGMVRVEIVNYAITSL